MKKVLSVTLALLMLASVLSGCGAKADSAEPATTAAAAQTQAATTAAAQTEAATTEEVKIDPVPIEIVDFNNLFSVSWEGGAKDSDTNKEITEKAAVILNYTSLDKDQVQLRIAGNDLGDLISVNNQATIANLVDSELVYPLNDLIKQYKPQFEEEFPGLLDAALALYPNEEGLIYALPTNYGNEGHGAQFGRYLYNIRWDLYKQLGYPEIKNPEDLIGVLSDMVALEPETAEGKKVYGESFYVTETSYYGMVNHFASTYGFLNLKGWYVFGDVKSGNQLSYDMLNEKGVYWTAADYYNKCYQAGILDPDAFTQKGADYNARVTSGELICSPVLQDPGYEKAQQAIDPETDRGYNAIPVEGTMFYANKNAPGWGATYALMIPKTCTDKDAVMRFISYAYSEEGSRVMRHGVAGKYWDYVDGVPQLTEEGYAIASAPVEEQYKAAWKVDCFSCITGYGKGEVQADGRETDLTAATEFFTASKYSRRAKEYCEKYGADYPYQVFENMKKEGKAYDLSSFNTFLTFPPSDEDVERIDNVCLSIAIGAIPKLVMAKDAAEFEAVKAATLQELKDAGAETAQAYYLDTWKAINGL